MRGLLERRTLIQVSAALVLGVIFHSWWQHIFDEGEEVERESIGAILNVSGDVKSRRVFAGVWNAAADNQEVSFFDRIRTGRNGAVQIEMEEGAAVSLTENSLAVLSPGDLALEGNVDVEAGIGSLRTPTGVIEFETREFDYVD